MIGGPGPMDPASAEPPAAALLDQQVGGFLAALAAADPAPGGGAAAAVTAALAAALVAMAARFSGAQLPDSAELARRADGERAELAGLVAADGHAYGEVLRALRLPRQPDPDERRDRLRAALAEATRIPMLIAESGARIAVAAQLLVERGNPNLRGDACTAAYLADAATRSAVELVRINVAMGDPDGDLLARAAQAIDTATRAAQASSATS